MTSSELTPVPSKRCFFVSPIGSETSPERLNSDIVMEYILRPVLNPLGYEVMRADQDPAPMMVRSILKDLLESDLVIADITGGNPNVFYEIAVRHCVGKPCITLLKKAEKAPFDVFGIKYISYDQAAPDVARTCEQLKARIEHIKNTPNYQDSDIAMLPGVQYFKWDTQ